jgi:hypothetical protein
MNATRAALVRRPRRSSFVVHAPVRDNEASPACSAVEPVVQLDDQLAKFGDLRSEGRDLDDQPSMCSVVDRDGASDSTGHNCSARRWRRWWRRRRKR